MIWDLAVARGCVILVCDLGFYLFRVRYCCLGVCWGVGVLGRFVVRFAWSICFLAGLV